MWKLFAPRLRRLTFQAVDDATAAGLSEADVIHLWLAILNDPQCAAVFIIENAGISVADLHTDIAASAPHNGSSKARAERLSPALLHIFDIAVNESRKPGHRHVGTEHVLLALTIAAKPPISQSLAKRGLSYQKAQDGLRVWIARNMPRQRPQRPQLRMPWPIERTIQAITRWPVLGYKVFIQKSLANPFYITRPYRLYRQLQKRWPVRRDPLLPVWVVSRYADVMLVLKDPRFRRDPFVAGQMPDALRDQLDAPPISHSGWEDWSLTVVKNNRSDNVL